MYKTIQTTTGQFSIQKLEKVLMHEHIVLGYAGWFYDPRCAEFDHAKAEEKTLDRLKRLRDYGVNLVVDPCPIELGRNPVFMQEMSVKSGVQIMCSTGFDLEARGYLSAFRTATAEEIRDIYLYEIENGIGPERIKPGIIKVATGYGQITDYEARIRQMLQEVSAALEKRIAQFGLDSKIQQIAKMTQNTSVREWKRAVKDTLGIDILDDYYLGELYEQAIQRWIAENVAYIKSLPTETLGNMRQIILDGYLNGRPIRDIQKDIQSEYGTSKRHAQLLARDQLATLNAQITKMQQTDAGCKKYRWSTSHDSRVRPCHAALNGKTFDWNDPPEMWYGTKAGRVYTGRKCHPGEAYCCRCVAIPVFDYDGVNIPMK